MTKLTNGKVEFQRLEQTHIVLEEQTANVQTVTNAVQQKWGAEFVVVTGDGLQVDDSSGTQGTWPSYHHYYSVTQVLHLSLY